MHPSALHLAAVATVVIDQADSAVLDTIHDAGFDATEQVVGLIVAAIGASGITALSTVKVTGSQEDDTVTCVFNAAVDLHFAGSINLGPGQSISAATVALPGLMEQVIRAAWDTAAVAGTIEVVREGDATSTSDNL